MKILVTGGCGFIGSHLVDELVNLNHDVIVVDNCSANNEEFYYNDKAKYYKIDICNYDFLKKAGKNCNFIFHLAAETRIQDTINNPKKTIETNILGTFNVLELCKQYKMKGMVFSSTSSIYGLSENTPITENEKEDCLNPYAATKYSAELLIKNYTKLYGVKSCIFRYFNVFGERAPAKGQYSLVTAIFLRQLKNKEPLTVVGDGLQERDFIYVKDIVKANVVALDQWDKNVELQKGNVFNIGSGYAINIKTLAEKMSDKIVYVPARQGEAKTNLSCSKKYRLLTGWKSQTDIIDWISSQ